MPRIVEIQQNIGFEGFREEKDPLCVEGYDFESLTAAAFDAISQVERNDEGKLSVTLEKDVVWNTKANPNLHPPIE